MRRYALYRVPILVVYLSHTHTHTQHFICLLTVYCSFEQGVRLSEEREEGTILNGVVSLRQRRLDAALCPP